MQREISDLETGAGAPAAAILFRQFVRAVCGDQQSGDMVADTVIRRIDPEVGNVHAFFRAGLARWRDIAVAEGVRPFTPAAVTARAWGLDHLPRHVGILVDVFGWREDEAARSLDLSVDECVGILATARLARRAPLGRAVLIVEDEPVIATRLAEIVTAMGSADVRVAHSFDSAVALAAASPPDVVLADYDLGINRPTGLDVTRVLAREYGTVAVFVTAHPAIVLTGAGDEPSFVLPKPFRDEAVQAALHFAATAERPNLLAA